MSMQNSAVHVGVELGFFCLVRHPNAERVAIRGCLGGKGVPEAESAAHFRRMAEFKVRFLAANPGVNFFVIFIICYASCFWICSVLVFIRKQPFFEVTPRIFVGFQYVMHVFFPYLFVVCKCHLSQR
jgi:hypothetical protein